MTSEKYEFGLNFFFKFLSCRDFLMQPNFM